MQRALLVANPSASGFTGSRYRAASATLRKSFELETVWPESAEGSRKAAAAAAGSGYDVVVAMGGDGVVHHAAAGLIHSDTALGIIPAGTTNVLARIVGIPKRAERAAEVISSYSPIALPTARLIANGSDGPIDRHALFSLGIGFDADVVDRAEQRPHAKLRFGAMHYARATVATVVGDYRGRVASISVRAADRRADAVSVMVQVHHAYTYLGRLPLRLGSADDGLVALAASKLSFARALRIFGTSATRGRANAPGSTLFEGVDRLIGLADPVAPVQADGESLGSIGGFEVGYERRALKVLVPTQPRRAS